MHAMIAETNRVDSRARDPPSFPTAQPPDNRFPIFQRITPQSSPVLRSSSTGSVGPTNVDTSGLTRTATADMDGGPNGHTRRRSSLMDVVAGGRDKSRPDTGIESRGQRKRNQGDFDEEDERKYVSDQGHITDCSSRSTSEEVELDDMSSEDGLDDEETGLTKQNRRRRRRRKRRHTRIDERIARGDMGVKEGKDFRVQSVLKRSLINASLIGLWYTFSLSISIYNTWMFSPGHLDFHFPLFTTSLHMVVQFSMASLVLYLFPRFRPRSDSLTDPHQRSQPQQSSVKKGKPLMTRTFYLTRIGPCGAATGLDIGLGNMSLKFITLTFYTMCKSSSLAFVLLFAFLFRLETPSIKLILIIATMTVGVIMMVAGETAFNVLGFILIISSAFFSGFRWGLTQILLLRNPATSNPFSSIFYLAPIMFVSLLLIALPVEGPRPLLAGLAALTESKGTFLGIGILLFPGLLAFLMTSSEFALLQRTSVVTLSICGIFKEVVTISAAGIVFHDPLTPINVSGLLVTIASIAAYNYIKISKMRNDSKEDGHQHHHHPHQPRTPANNGMDNENDDGATEPMLPPDTTTTPADITRTPQGKSRTSTSSITGLAMNGPAARPSVSIPLPGREALRTGVESSPSPARTSPVKRAEDLK